MHTWYTGLYTCLQLEMVLIYQAVVAMGLLHIASSNAEKAGNCNLFPNVIPTPKTYSIGQLLTAGPWYAYLSYNTDYGRVPQDPLDVNVVNYYTSLGTSREPTRTQPAEIIVQERRRYVNNTCMYTLNSAVFTTDGRQFGTAFDFEANGSIVNEAHDESIIWSTDQKTYMFFFWCAEHDLQSGNCASTHTYVYTRSKPNALTNDEKQSIADAMNKVLQPYCLQSSKFAQYQWDDSLPECPKTEYPDCFTHNINAYKTLIDRKSDIRDEKGAKAVFNNSGSGKINQE